MTDAQLAEAQKRRTELLTRDDRQRQETEAAAKFEAEIDRRIDLVFSEAEHPGVSQATTVGPDARHKLRFLLRYYAKKDHPFTSCVADNMKRFGPNRTERVCATIKDVIRGTTHWRGHPELDHGAPGAVAASDEQPPEFDAEIADILLSLDPSKLEILFSDSEAA